MDKSTLGNRIKAYHFPFEATLGISRTVAILLVSALVFMVGFGVWWFIQSAPPKTLTFATGPTNSSYYRTGERYREILKKSGIKVNLVATEGGLDNFQILTNAGSKVDLALVQSGMADGPQREKLMSLGAVNYLPLYIFYRGKEVEKISDFADKTISVGERGTGARVLSKMILTNHGLGKVNTIQLAFAPEEAVEKLIAGEIDVAFMMGDSISGGLIRKAIQAPGVHEFDFVQAETYARRFPFLSHVVMPIGGFDLKANLPPHEVHMVAPVVELLAQKKLHPALIDLILDAATEIHSRPSTLRKKNEFPKAVENEVKLSPDAVRYYKTGKSFLYRYMPFWIASMLSRLLFVLVPILVVVLPGIQILPTLLSLGMKLTLYRWYRGLLAIEQEIAKGHTVIESVPCGVKLAEIEGEVAVRKVPASFANAVYILKGHIAFVREKLVALEKGAPVKA